MVFCHINRKKTKNKAQDNVDLGEHSVEENLLAGITSQAFKKRLVGSRNTILTGMLNWQLLSALVTIQKRVLWTDV